MTYPPDDTVRVTLSDCYSYVTVVHNTKSIGQPIYGQIFPSFIINVSVWGPT